MRIGIINTQAPFITGGAERHAANLCRAFRERGFDATEISVPFKWYPARTLVDHILAAKLLDLGEVEGTAVDLAIGLKFPAYLARHPNKTFWILHQHRQAYDLWQSELADLHHDPDGMAVRALIHEEDRRALGAPGARVYSNSHNVSQRLTRHLGLPSTPLYHPPPQAAMMRQGAYGDYLFAPSRMNGAKRQMLMLEALALSRSDARIVFAGPADNDDFMRAFRARARELGVEKRVTCLGAVDDETMLRCYAECRGVLFVPVDEDYGYITLEAMLSGKAVVTATDSGGALEFIDDGVEGLVVAPEAASIAAALDRLTDDANLAERMGMAGLARYRAMGIGWDTVVATLTDGAAPGADPLGADPSALLRHANRGLSREAVPAPEPEPDEGIDDPASLSGTEAEAEEPDAPGAPEPGAAVTVTAVTARPVVAAPVVAGRPTVSVSVVPGRGAPVAASMPMQEPEPEPQQPGETEEPEEASEADALAALQAAVASLPMPGSPPFGSFADLASAYEFGIPGQHRDDGAEEASSVSGARWRHHLALLALAMEDRTDRVLDIGAEPPFALHALLAAARPGTRIDGTWRDPRPLARTIRGLRDGLPDLDVALAPVDVEREPLPAGNATYDLVIGAALLERLALDPLFFVAEAARVLRPGGRLVLATPNVAGHRALRRMLDGDAPYASGVFVPTGGVRGRHNREYAPGEVARLGEAAGFVTERLLTADLHDGPADAEVAALLAGRGPLDLRGDTIFYVGRLEAHGAPTVPDGLYRDDPRQLSGRLRLLGRDPVTGTARIGVENLSPTIWYAHGEGRVGLSLDWADARGTLVHVGGRMALPAALERGATVEIALPLDPGGPDASKGTLAVSLLQGDAGRMEATGRIGGLTLPCREATFLRLVRGSA